MNDSSTVILLKSVTEANKAKKQLSNYRIKCAVEKIHEKQGGCCYGIRVYENPEKVCRLLSIIDVECGEVVQ